MSDRRVDNCNRYRCVNVGFRLSPEEAEELNVKVALSGLSKRDYIVNCLRNTQLGVVCWQVYYGLPMRLPMIRLEQIRKE